ncbi:MAG: flippase [Flavobacteriales bacterium]|nr:flippase [Flavobacteriales bacterium]
MKKGVFHNSVLTLIRQVLSIGFGLLATMIIARVLGAEGQGKYTLAILLPTLLYTLLNSGLSASTVYFIGKGKYTDDEVYSTNLLSSLLLSAFSMLVGGVIVLFFKEYFFEGLASQLLVYTLLILPLIFLQRNLQTIFQGKEEFEKFNLIVILNQFGLLFFSFVFLYVLDLGLIGAIFSFASSQLIMLFASFYFLHQSYGLFWPKKYSIQYFKEGLTFGVKGHLSNVLSFVNYRIDMFLIAYFIDDVAVGIYSIAVLLVERVWLVSQSVSTVLFARVANLNTDLERNRFTSLAARNTFFITFLGGLFLAIFSHWIIVILFGDEYVNSIIPFLYMIPGVVIFSLGKVLANDFTGRGYPEINTYIAFVVALTNFGLNIWLIPTYGIKGAALATSTSYILDSTIKSIVFSIKNKVSILDIVIIKMSDFQLYKTEFLKLYKSIKR